MALVLAWALPVLAGEEAAPPPQATAEVPWWGTFGCPERSPDAPKSDPAWKVHAEATLSATMLQGSTSGDTEIASVALYARRGRVMNRVGYDLNRSDLSYAGVEVDPGQASQTLSEIVTVCLSRRLFGIAGAQLFTDEATYVELRWSGYGGVGFELAQTARHQLDAIAALGYESLEYDAEEPLARLGAIPRHERSEAAYAGLAWYWVVSPRVVLQQSAWLAWLGERDMGDRREASATMSFAFNKHVAFTLSADVAYHDNDVLRLLHQDRTSSSQTVGIKVSY